LNPREGLDTHKHRGEGAGAAETDGCRENELGRGASALAPPTAAQAACRRERPTN